MDTLSDTFDTNDTFDTKGTLSDTFDTKRYIRYKVYRRHEIRKTTIESMAYHNYGRLSQLEVVSDVSIHSIKRVSD